MVNWEKLCSNLSFTVESKMKNLHKAGRISNVSSNFKNLQTSQTKYKFKIYDFRTIFIVILGHFRTNSSEF